AGPERAVKSRGVIRREGKTFEAQLQRGLAQVLRQRGGTLKLKLDPNDLGTVKISLKLSQGRVDGSIEATNERAHDLLKQHVELLKHSLERRGITVDRLDVRHAGAAESGRQNEAGPEAQHGLTRQNAGSGDDRQTDSGRGEDRPQGNRDGIPGESEEAGVRGADSATDDELSHGREGEPLAGWLRLDTVV
ncbi:MAG TPA: flagellar hook-length control protein FliK, partial [Phycisphaerales bacterium]|nr:flagellar hook-length control protein FliK [Phycisphaerales bacterium]